MKSIKLPIAALLIIVSIETTFAQLPPTAEVKPATSAANYSGKWATSFGELTLTQTTDVVAGEYPTGKVVGKVRDGKFEFRYTEAKAAGEGVFQLNRSGDAFTGKWRVDGTEAWLPWNGRLLNKPPPTGFAGLWETSFGRMRLHKQGEDIAGSYEAAGGSSITGQLKEKRFVFRYVEPNIQGIGWFELSKDGQAMTGKWRPDGESAWQPWLAKRAKPVVGRTWLVILEANWETSLNEPEYSFGEMLRSYFKMPSARHVQVRHRFFHDYADFKKQVRSVQFLAEPVVLLISTHGDAKGITVGGTSITADQIADSFQSTANIKLLHLSGCSMMVGKAPAEIQAKILQKLKTRPFPISGYKTDVAWDESALGDFTYLSFLLLRKLAPADAAQHAIRVSPYLGDVKVRESKFQALGLKVLEPTK